MGDNPQDRPIQYCDGSGSDEITIARYISLTFPEPGKIILKLGPGDHTVRAFEISRDQLRTIILDGIPAVLK